MSIASFGTRRRTRAILGTTVDALLIKCPVALSVVLAVALVGCSSSLPPGASPEPPASTVPAAAANPSRGASAAAVAAVTADDLVAPSGPVQLRPRARWVGASWSDLPGWPADKPSEAMPALLRSCEKPAPAWAATCASARREAVPLLADDATARAWLEQHLRPWRIESTAGEPTGLATGYFEPLVDASRTSRPGFRIALHAPPPDLASKKPYWTRQQLDTLPAARRSLAGSELAWLRDPLDLLLLQVQGSGRLAFVDERGKPEATVRIAYAAHNDQPYQSVGRWLVDQGELRLDQASWPAIRAWARAHPKRVDELLWANPRVVFFREEPLPDPSVGPKGAQGVPLTPGRSIAVDPQSVPYGTPVWLDTTEPLTTTPLRRLVVAQDTGSAIVGAVRADYFWGWGESAEAQAGRMKQPLRAWVLLPR